MKTKSWDYVSGRKSKPVPLQPESPSEEEAKAISEWEYEDFKARADIFLLIKDAELKAIKKCKTSKEILTKLENEYESKAPAREASIWRDLGCVQNWAYTRRFPLFFTRAQYI